MSSASDSTPDLTGEDAAIVFGVPNVYFNEIIVYALMHDKPPIHCVSHDTAEYLFVHFSLAASDDVQRYSLDSSKASKSGTSRIVMVFAILLLYVRFGFIDNDKDVMTVFARLTGFNSRWTVAQIADGVTSIIGTIIADGTMHDLHDVIGNDELSEFASRNDWTMLYLSLILATTLMCTSLIVYRILSVGGVKAGLRTYRRVMEVAVESAALYSVALIIYIAFISHNTLANSYIDIITASIKSIAPTLFVGRVVAARPNDSWKDKMSKNK
ncbi:uncharacterized protein BT62DRAFT_1008185 [Guyanagaster necrorhizus]|uniref:Uncharacterized protein n=1 Tax=Guyanagaster necrorhizus TaxID=856835 RepID=A0A9P7VNM7_9AGAR|nr:uncharacterized protein BT62DRAFT_1008185 [Guyanagaster necrorhizus MCA 3950]KAG7444526.1 hypothetical protein BT62DRAFT_1008185 [Guyanagaster necrorhizus MCA 3950]